MVRHFVYLVLLEMLLQFAVPCIGGALLAALLGHALDPKTSIHENVVVALVSDQCPVAREVVKSALTYPALREHMITIPIDDRPTTDSDFRGAACGIAIEHIHAEAPWLRLVPSGWLCAQVILYGAALHQDYFTGTPGFVRNDKPITLAELDTFLSEHGFVRRRGLIRPLDQLPLAEPVGPASLKETTVRGSDIGF